MCLVYLSIACFQPVFKRLSVPLSVLIWITLLTLYFTYFCLKDLRTAMDGVPYLYYIIFVTYAMLPLPLILSAIFGALTSFLQLLLGGLMQNNVSNFMWMQVTNENCESLRVDCAVNTVISSDGLQFVSMKISYPNYLHMSKPPSTVLGDERSRGVMCAGLKQGKNWGADLVYYFAKIRKRRKYL